MYALFNECNCSGDRMAGVVDAIQESGLGGLDLRQWRGSDLGLCSCAAFHVVLTSVVIKGVREPCLKLWFSWLC